MSTKIFFCYAREDENYLNELKRHITPLVRENVIELWHDRNISAGTPWEQEISEHLNEAQIILLLVSSDFTASEYAYGIELKRALERHKRGEARVIPVIVRPVYRLGELSRLQALPKDALPVSDQRWHTRDAAWCDVAESLHRVVDDLPSLLSAQKEQEGGPQASVVAAPVFSPPSTPSPSQDRPSKILNSTFTVQNPPEQVYPPIEPKKQHVIPAFKDTKVRPIKPPLQTASVLSLLRHLRPMLQLSFFGILGNRVSSFLSKHRPVRIVLLLLVLVLLLPLFVTQSVWFPQWDGIGVTRIDGEDIGISDGRYALDTDPNWVNKDAIALKESASENLRNGKQDQAIAMWNQAHAKDPRDAESLIYAADQMVLKSHASYITIVIGVALGMNVPDGFSRDTLQGAYIRQMECNQDMKACGGKKLRLLIARSGSTPNNSQRIAQQIVQAAQFDKTIVAVQGWTTSTTTLNAVYILGNARLPIVAGDIASDKLTGKPYFFRISPPSSLDVLLKTTYIEKQLKSQQVVIFRDSNDTFSKNLSDTLANQFDKDKYKTYHVEDFTISDETGLVQKIENALTTYKPDLIYITTTAVEDVKTVLNTIPSTPENANLKVFAGGAGYELVQSDDKPNGYAHLLFSVSAYPDEWGILALGNPEPPFFREYSGVYDPNHQHPGVYGFDRANSDVMMGYDALSPILVASKNVIQQGKQNPTSEDIKNALSQINGSRSFQGITGAISFGSNGNPINKVSLVIRVVDDNGPHNHLAAYQGCFLLNAPKCDNGIHIFE